MILKVLLFSFLVAHTLASPTASAYRPHTSVRNEQCPVKTLKDEVTCRGQASECWSPGEGDIDCPNNGLCCFDGCVNKCKVPGEDVVVYQPPPLCGIVYEQREEDVTMDHCVDVPDVQKCVEETKQNCREECKIIQEPYTVIDKEKCCITKQELVCEDLPCNADGHHEVGQPLLIEECDHQEGHCWKVPDQQCVDKQVPDCKLVKKPIETQVPYEVCSTQYREECKTLYKEWCPDTREGRLGINCQKMPYKKCEKVPYEHCQHLTKIEITYVDENVCTKKTIKDCKIIEKEECRPATEQCKIDRTGEKIPIKNNCNVKEKVCRLIPKETCSVVETPNQLFKEVRKCNDVCEPYKVKRCEPKKTREECTTITKTMYYNVPVEKCE